MIRTAFRASTSLVSAHTRFTSAGIFALLLVGGARASDHADPIFNRRMEAGITDLFAFPAKDGLRMTPEKGKDGKPIRDEKQNFKYRFTPGTAAWRDDAVQPNEIVLILCVRRSLTTSPPFGELNRYTYKIHLDCHSEVDYVKDTANLERYGGTVVNPRQIDPDASIIFEMNNDTSLRRIEFLGFQNRGLIPKPFTGVRDDPFIFPQFFGTNVIAFVARIPIRCLPATQKTDCLIWATSERDGKQIDHVGRSQRTQLPRFDLLNTIPPSEHLKALHESNDDPSLLDDILRNIITPPFVLRPYDYQPDVMFYSRESDREPRYPNGRQLEDDVALLTCLQGDCQLFELSQSHPKFSKGPAGRPTANDKPFSNTFPYLADPHPDSDPPKPPRGPIAPSFSTRNWVTLTVAALILLTLLITPWLLYRRANRRLLRVTQQLAALQARPAISEGGT
ncbi:MAG TPA: hypothetical protein VLM40_16340 [Gemmata sp.]|nr:hypothetical protein [Gemmata sp.]